VYFVGTSHIGTFSDYLVHKCAGLDEEGKVHGLKHSNLHAGNLYFEDGKFIKDRYKSITRVLYNWLHNTYRIAICLQIGSWDVLLVSRAYALEVALDDYEKLIVHIKSRIKNSTTRVDFHIMTTRDMA
jgi:hypothetical protein